MIDMTARGYFKSKKHGYITPNFLFQCCISKSKIKKRGSIMLYPLFLQFLKTNKVLLPNSTHDNINGLLSFSFYEVDGQKVAHSV